jgi:hypothetical protein
MNISGTFLWPNSDPGEKNEDSDLSVFIPDGPLPASEEWACTIENKDGAVVVEDRGELERLIGALQRALEIIDSPSNDKLEGLYGRPDNISSEAWRRLHTNQWIDGDDRE